MKNEITLPPGGSLKGELIPPGDKSISHRSVILGSLAQGKSTFQHFLTSEDCLNTLEAFKKMGVHSELKGDTLSISGVGMQGLQAPQSDLNMGNSGTSTRLLLGILAAQSFSSHLYGDTSLSKRPMDRVVKPLRLMGAEIAGKESGKYLPIEVIGKPLRGIRYELPVTSAQVKSCLMLAGLFAEGQTIVTEPHQSRNHTELAFHAFGAKFKQQPSKLEYIVERTEKLNPISYRIPGDISSAAFFIVGALLTKGSEIQIKNVGLNFTRTGLISTMQAMGANIKEENKTGSAEVSGDLIVKYSPLKAFNNIAADIAPLMIDEIPILTLAAALAEGTTVIGGVKELRVKESDRIAVMVQNLKAIGAHVTEREDGFEIKGTGGGLLEGGKVQSHGDHRVAMTFAIASLVCRSPVTIEGIDCIPTSYPNFFQDLKSVVKKP